MRLGSRGLSLYTLTVTAISTPLCETFYWQERPLDLSHSSFHYTWKWAGRLLGLPNWCFVCGLSTHTQLSPLSGHLPDVCGSLSSEKTEGAIEERRETGSLQWILALFFLQKKPLHTVCFELRWQACNLQGLTLHLTFRIITHSGHNTQWFIKKITQQDVTKL